MKRCLLDMDGVLVDFVAGACHLFGQSNPYVDGTFTDFYMNNAWNMTPNDFFENMGYDFWAELDWMHDGRAIFDFVDEAFGPENTCILTSPVNTWGCFDGKIAWIKRNLPKAYHRKFLVGPAKSFCAGDDRVLIDDRDENITEFIAAGGNGLLVPRPWNSNRKLTLTSKEYITETYGKLLKNYQGNSND
jgi:5'(3')-deoxyribonucleotidase